MIEFINESGIISPTGIDVGGAETAVITFSDHLFRELITNGNGKIIGELPGCASITVYEINYNGKRMVATKCPVGAPAAASAIEELIVCGIENIVAYGICGTLTDIPTRNLVVPDVAFRDEGTSYHYAPPSESVDVKNHGKIAEYFDTIGQGYTMGGVWTTDGFYRETRTRANYMKERGCVSVDMECSALQTVCNVRGKEYYVFFISADSLAGEEWQPNYILDDHKDRVTADVVATIAALDFASKL